MKSCVCEHTCNAGKLNRRRVRRVIGACAAPGARDVTCLARCNLLRRPDRWHMSACMPTCDDDNEVYNGCAAVQPLQYTTMVTEIAGVALVRGGRNDGYSKVPPQAQPSTQRSQCGLHGGLVEIWLILGYSRVVLLKYRPRAQCFKLHSGFRMAPAPFTLQ